MLLILYGFLYRFFFFKQKTAYEMRISDWSSDVCSSDLPATTLLLALDSAATEKLRAERAAEGKSLEPHEAQGMTPEDVLDFFYDKITYKRSGNGWATPFDADRLRGVKLAQDLIAAKTGEAVADRKSTRLNSSH